MKAIRLIGIIAALSVAALTQTPQVMAQERPRTIPLSPYLGVLWSFEADFGGKRRTFLFDTAGGITAITPESAAEIACLPWGQLTGFRMRGDRVDLPRCDDVTIRSNGATLAAPTVGVLDFSTLLPKDAPPLAGSVALDSFAGNVVTIDLAHRQIVLETTASMKRRISSGREVELRLSREVAGLAMTPFVAVQTPKGKVWMELDTGSNSSIIVSAHDAELFAMKPHDKEPQTFRGKLVGDIALAVDDARSMPLAIDGNIGAGVLKDWIVTLDIVRGRAWFSPASGSWTAIASDQ
ncbi:hypothetical protein C8J42_11821 [Sphingomonas sp. PP-CE-1A-559]|uniref:hypothetical protein n=1 Tax=Sphingomonas sp. PP-CE-1A-559 TaxID=2135657 RepID=UPI001056DA13|nr:hypothetical protein [Sphingomonas sp. PP-CE-1A-559]TCP83639.1 hypothetical protein C8J42_11821 [Sphingomonas sp. PP-CE-1A-559]